MPPPNDEGGAVGQRRPQGDVQPARTNSQNDTLSGQSAQPAGSNRLPILAGVITTCVSVMRRSARETAEMAVAIGETLIEAKALVPHGEWEPWLAANALMSGRSARGYMQLAKAGLKTATVADLGIRHSLRMAARLKPRPPRLRFPAADLRHDQVWFATTNMGDLFLADFAGDIGFHAALFDDQGVLHTRRPIERDHLPAQLSAFGIRGAVNLGHVGHTVSNQWILGLVRGTPIDDPEMVSLWGHHRDWATA